MAADKNALVQFTISMHLQEFSKRVAGVVDDYNAVKKNPSILKKGTTVEQFNESALNDVAILVETLESFLAQTLQDAGIPLPPNVKPVQVKSARDEGIEAEILNLADFRKNGGMVN